ncbi:choline/glycine/proline betaine transport protein [Leucobacter exalbidus]|uniref:Choline/glycine/proline betaine transport protein n=1 Tax=Leucobacter exalbidus TaxID=662960 RepID=A0A940T2R2_9MICO|nr:choline BCCT transporter BetT [Leucobacter exalbidus]MBP1324869.1 choline/glycine/proline betaine transport protein [Leucobacter exalbidus]
MSVAAEPTPKDAEPDIGALSLKSPAPRWPVLIGSAAVILAIALWAILARDQADSVINTLVAWTAENFGWYYVLTAGLVLIFVIGLAFSPAGRTKLGPDHAKPQFSMFTWASMLFAAGIGIDLMFFSVSEPVAQYVGPPSGDGGTIEAARQAIVWTFFHYGPVGWAMYALMGGAFAYFAYRRNLPLNIRSLLTPLFGKRVEGWGGHTIDILAVLGTVFGIATTLGIGVVQLSYGMHVLFGTPDGVAAQISLIVLAVVMATLSTVSGVEKGIRRLSEANVILAIALLVWILITGETRRLLEGLVMNVGDFMTGFSGMLFDTFAWERPDDWMQGWTLFFWAWWIAWAPFVGLFLARISRGRSLRQFIFGVLVIPFGFIAIFISIFGNSALEIVLGGNAAFADTAMNLPERAFFDLLQQYPAAPVVIAVALLTGLLFYVTSADSGALVLSNLTSHVVDPKQDGSKPLRIFWSITTGLLTLGMLLVGGVSTLQQATLIIGLPVSVLLYLVMISLFRALRTEAQHIEGYEATKPLRYAPAETSWRRRLRRSTTFPHQAQVMRYIDSVTEPALMDVTDELRKSGVEVECERLDVEGLGVQALHVTARFPDQQDFTYQIYPVAHELPNFAYRSVGTSEYYFRLEVFTATGSHGYDVYGFDSDQIISDVLGHYESHLEYLRISSGGTDASVGENEYVVTDWSDDFEPPTSPITLP